jgi:hypothetical protein
MWYSSDIRLLQQLLGLRDAQFAGDEFGEEGVSEVGKFYIFFNIFRYKV